MLAIRRVTPPNRRSSVTERRRGRGRDDRAGPMIGGAVRATIAAARGKAVSIDDLDDEIPF